MSSVGWTVHGATAFGDASVIVNRQTKSLRFLLYLINAKFGGLRRRK